MMSNSKESESSKRLRSWHIPHVDEVSQLIGGFRSLEADAAESYDKTR
jgi:hypothetical protein